jgi:hypothetical protein
MKFVASYRLLIPTVKTIRLTGCLLALLACSQLTQAQADVDSVVDEVIAPPTVEENKQPSEKISLPDPFEMRRVPDSTVHRYKKDDDFEYANDPDYWAGEREQALKRKREQEQREQLERDQDTLDRENKKGFWDHFNDFFSGNVIRNITYFVLIGFFLFIIYRIAVVNKLFLFYSSKKVKAESSAEEVDIADDNLDERIRKAVAAKEYRPAVRYMYLKTLQLLNERQLIRYQADATNYEYVTQMGQHKLGNDFGFLTRIYDYVWYGEFILTDEQFELVHKNFSHFYNALHS